MQHLTVRNIPDDLARALDAERIRRGTSLNRTVIDLLRAATGTAEAPFDNGLGHFAGTWDERELEEFERAVAPFEQVDEELWR